MRPCSSTRILRRPAQGGTPVADDEASDGTCAEQAAPKLLLGGAIEAHRGLIEGWRQVMVVRIPYQDATDA